MKLRPYVNVTEYGEYTGEGFQREGQSVGRSVGQSVSPASQQASQTASQKVRQPVRKSDSQSASQADSQCIYQLATQPTWSSPAWSGLVWRRAVLYCVFFPSVKVSYFTSVLFIPMRHSGEDTSYDCVDFLRDMKNTIMTAPRNAVLGAIIRP